MPFYAITPIGIFYSLVGCGVRYNHQIIHDTRGLGHALIASRRAGRRAISNGARSYEADNRPWYAFIVAIEGQVEIDILGFATRSGLSEEGITHGQLGARIPGTEGGYMVATGLGTGIIHAVEDVRYVHLSEVVALIEDGIRTVVGYEPGQSLHIPAHIFESGEVEGSAGTGFAVIVALQRHEFIGVARLLIDIPTLLCSKGGEAQHGVRYVFAKVHEVAIRSRAVERVYRDPERGVLRLEDIVLSGTRHTVVLIGTEAEGRGKDNERVLGCIVVRDADVSHVVVEREGGHGVALVGKAFLGREVVELHHVSVAE